MPNDRFYRIDTALLTPTVDTAELDPADPRPGRPRDDAAPWTSSSALPMFEQYVTIACVSNEVGGRLVGNAKWTGVRLRDVLDMAGVQSSATQLVGRSVDGWTAGMPTAWVMDPAREPMIALKMNDEPLPPVHGYPGPAHRPGLYGYVSATKWLAELELTTLEAFDGYWVPLGWAKEAPILTQSRIDTPRVRRRHRGRARADRGDRLGAGPRASRGSRSRSTAPGGRPGCRARSPTRPGSSGSSTGTRPPASTRSRSAPPTAPAPSRTERQTPPAPDGARGWHDDRGPGRLTDRSAGRIRYRVRACLDVAIIFDPPERFVAGTVGQPGDRTFFLQARDGAAS